MHSPHTENVPETWAPCPRAPTPALTPAPCSGCPLSPKGEPVHTPFHISGLVSEGLRVADGHADPTDGGVVDPVQGPLHRDGAGRHIGDLEAFHRAGSWGNGLLSRCWPLLAPGGGQGLKKRPGLGGCWGPQRGPGEGVPSATQGTRAEWDAQALASRADGCRARCGPSRFTGGRGLNLHLDVAVT